MALLFIDSCGDHYSTAQINRKWDSNVSGQVLAGTGRRSTNCLDIAPTVGVVRSYTKLLGSSIQTLIVGCAINITGFNAGTMQIFQLVDSATLQVDLRLDATGHPQVTRNGTVLGTSTYVFNLGIEHYIELKCKIDDSVGTYEVHVDGVQVLVGSSADTKNTANATADRVVFGPFGSGSTGVVGARIDDIYICDSSGSANNDFLGDIRVDAVLPSGDGSNSGLTTSTGSAHAALVDETPATDDTDYNQSASVGNKDTYAFTDITHTPSAIFGAQVCLQAKKDDAGARSICAVTRSGGSDFDGSAQVLSTSYAVFRTMLELDPNTSAAWTKTNLNAAEFGMKVQA